MRMCAGSALRRVWLVLNMSLMCCSLAVLRVHPHGSHVSTLHSIICVLFTAHPHARVSHARCVVSSEGDSEDGRRLSCVLGENKVAEYEYSVWGWAVTVHLQQPPSKLHEEAWAGHSQNQEVEIAPGCAVCVTCPSCPR